VTLRRCHGATPEDPAPFPKIRGGVFSGGNKIGPTVSSDRSLKKKKWPWLTREHVVMAVVFLALMWPPGLAGLTKAGGQGAMKTLSAAAVATWMCAGVAFADSLSWEELTLKDQAFVIAAVGSVKVTHECEGYEMVPGALMKYGASAGVDVLRIGNAIAQAVRLSLHLDYDASKAIPEVTRLVYHTAETLINEELSGKADFCKRWTNYYIDQRLIRKK
jgi:hypothetical protein